jgi:predicted nuclease with TOPRIM domain
LYLRCNLGYQENQEVYTDTKERLAQNQQKMKGLQQRLQLLESEKQEILQEVLRLDGENRLLKDMEKKDD